MTEPTQAQIDAAAVAMWKLDDEHYKMSHYENLAKAALTAAAGVEDECLKEVNRELAAVALGIKDEAIDRCAQVAERYVGHSIAGKAAVHAIRALKTTREVSKL